MECSLYRVYGRFRKILVSSWENRGRFIFHFEELFIEVQIHRKVMQFYKPNTLVHPAHDERFQGAEAFGVLWTLNLAVQAPLEALASPSVKWAQCHPQPERPWHWWGQCVNCEELSACEE